MSLKSNDFINIDILFLHYDKALTGLPVKAELTDMSIVDVSEVTRNIRSKRFANTYREKFHCGRYNWYVQRIKQFVKRNPGKEIVVSKWSIKSGYRPSFVFNNTMYPDVLYTYDSQEEYWFCARVNKRTKHLLIQYEARSITQPPLAKFLFGQSQPDGNLTSFTFPKNVMSPYQNDNIRHVDTIDRIARKRSFRMPQRDIRRQPMYRAYSEGSSAFPKQRCLDLSGDNVVLEEEEYLTETSASPLVEEKTEAASDKTWTASKPKRSVYRRFLNKCAKLGRRFKTKDMSR